MAMTRPALSLSRRALLSCGGLLAAGVVLPACQPRGAHAQLPMTVYRDASCRCCHLWWEQARAAGFDATLIDHPDMRAARAKFAVPEPLTSCHTAIVEGLVFEGHVPFAEVRRLLRERPGGVAGLAVPGMPIGSPGMEVPGRAQESFAVIAFGPAGQTVFARYG